MDEVQLRRVFSELVNLLIDYEVTVSAYEKAFQIINAEAERLQLPLDPVSAVNQLIMSPNFRVSATQRYAKFSEVQKKVTSVSLNLVLAGIRDIIAHRTGQPPPG